MVCNRSATDGISRMNFKPCCDTPVDISVRNTRVHRPSIPVVGKLDFLKLKLVFNLVFSLRTWLQNILSV